jgi:hypothetical protein
MKKRLSSLMALVLLVVFSLLPAGATLTNSSTYSPYGDVQLYTALITAASNDTTTNADSNVIYNQGGTIKDLCAGVKATNQTGTSPTLTVSFLGAFDSSGPFFAIKTAQGGTAGTVGTLATSALDINTASTTNVSTGLCTSHYGLAGALLPPYLKVRVAVGGSATPGWTGVAYAAVKRGK